MNFDKLHWWEFPLGEFSIKLKDDFKNSFFNEVYKKRRISKELSYYISKKSANYRKPLDLKRQRALLWAHKSTSKFVPAWLIYELAKFIKLDLKKIEKNIESYLSFKGKVIISKPKFPVQVTPEFTAIAVHIMCDGFAYPNGKFSYCQKKEVNMERFIKIVKNVFGGYNSRYNKKTAHTPIHYLPKIFGNIISDYYRIETYLSSQCEMPKKLKNLGELHKVSALAAFLLDDGNATSTVRFYSPSKKFLLDTIDIMESLNYQYGKLVERKSKKNKEQNLYSIIIKDSSIVKFHQDLKRLFVEFPNLHIGEKFWNIEKIIHIKNRGWKHRGKGTTKSIILNSLKEGPKTAFELRDITDISLWTVYHHLQDLIKLSKVLKCNNKLGKVKYKLR